MRLLPAIFLLALGCSPLISSPYDEKYQLELTLHEVQTNLDDLRHELGSFRSELQIIDSRIRYNEETLTAFKQNGLEKSQARLEHLASEIQSLEKRFSSRSGESEELRHLTAYAKETTAALTQFKSRIEELEKELIAGKRNLDEFARVTRLSRLYKVRQGDSLEKIAKFHKTTVEKIKKLNSIEQDLIVVGQELKIPSE